MPIIRFHRPKWIWRDLWIGLYVGQTVDYGSHRERTLYLCPLPTLLLSLSVAWWVKAEHKRPVYLETFEPRMREWDNETLNHAASLPCLCTEACERGECPPCGSCQANSERRRRELEQLLRSAIRAK